MKGLFLSVAAVFAVACALGGTGSAASGSESAQGNYTQFGGVYDISFSAKATLLNTEASGHIRWINHGTDPDTILDADVTCLVVGPARTATLAGVVTSFTGPGAFPQQGVFITVKDNGQGPTALAPDTASPPVTTAAPPPANCVPPFVVSQFPISSGDITVKPAL